MPTSALSSRRCAGSSSRAWPATRMLPRSIFSSPLMQRSAVLLPDPLRPISATTCPFSTLSEIPCSTLSVPKLLWTSSTSTCDMELPFEVVAEPRQRPADHEIEGGDRQEDRSGLEGRVVDELP